MVSENYYDYKFPDEVPAETFRRYYSDDQVDLMFTNISQALCFADCVPVDVLKIYVGGRKVKFAGWQPKMLFEFKYVDDNTTAWTNYFPDWDH